MKTSRSSLLINQSSRFSERSFWLMLGGGGLSVLGGLCLSLSFLLPLSFQMVLGLVLVAAGFLSFLADVQVFTGKDLIAKSGLSLLYVSAGLIVLFEHTTSGLGLKYIIGSLLLIDAFISLYLSLSKKLESGHAWFFSEGLLSLLAGGIILWSSSADMMKTIATFIGLNFIYSSFALIFQAKHLANR